MCAQIMPVAGYDCETTGTDVTRDRIVSAALVQRAADGTTTTSTWLIDPGVPVPAAALAIHGLSTQHLRAHGAQPAEALDQIAEALAGCLAGGVPLLVYNAPFDLRILDAELKRHDLPTLATRLGAPVRPVVDPLVIDRAVDRYRKGGRKLPDLISEYRVAPAGHLHDATDDVVNAIAVFDAIMRGYPSVPTDVMELHDWQVRQHREWAVNFNHWLEGKGKDPSADPSWP